MEKILIRTGTGEFLEILLPPDMNFGSVREAAEKAAGLFPPEYRENLPLMSGADLRKLGEALWKVRNSGTAPESGTPADLSSSFPAENQEDTEEKRNRAVLPETAEFFPDHVRNTVSMSDRDFFPDGKEEFASENFEPHENLPETSEGEKEKSSSVQKEAEMDQGKQFFKKFFLPVREFFREPLFRLPKIRKSGKSCCKKPGVFRRKEAHGEIPQEGERIQTEHTLSDIELAYHFKWTLEYVRSLPEQDRKNCLAFLHGEKSSVSPAPAPVLPVSPELLKETTERAFAALKRFQSSELQQ